MKKLVIVQQYVPKYRVPFFESLQLELQDRDVDLTIAAASPKGHLVARNDAADKAWITRVPEYGISLFSRNLILGGSRSAWKSADGVIFPLQGTSIDAHRAIIAALSNRQRIGLWGHVKSYVNDPNILDQAAERWLMKRADQIFAYTPGGAEFARLAGIPNSRITTVMNTIDTQSLQVCKSKLSQQEAQGFLESLNISGTRVYSFIGGLDSSKRISFIAQVLDVLWARDPSIIVIVGGEGDQRQLLSKAADRGQIRLLGHVDEKTKALMSMVSIGIMMPGRIGLVAVEALALDIPIVTTNWDYHAPENEYLTEGISRFSSNNNEDSYADLVIDVADRTRNERAPSNPGLPTIDMMVQNYADGISRMFSL